MNIRCSLGIHRYRDLWRGPWDGWGQKVVRSCTRCGEWEALKFLSPISGPREQPMHPFATDTREQALEVAKDAVSGISRYRVMSYEGSGPWVPLVGSWKNRYVGIATGRFTPEGKEIMFHLGPIATDKPWPDALIAAEMMKAAQCRC